MCLRTGLYKIVIKTRVKDYVERLYGFSTRFFYFSFYTCNSRMLSINCVLCLDYYCSVREGKGRESKRNLILRIITSRQKKVEHFLFVFEKIRFLLNINTNYNLIILAKFI